MPHQCREQQRKSKVTSVPRTLYRTDSHSSVEHLQRMQNATQEWMTLEELESHTSAEKDPGEKKIATPEWRTPEESRQAH